MKSFKTEKPILCIGDLIADVNIPYGETMKYSKLLSTNVVPDTPAPEARLIAGGTTGNTAAGILKLGGKVLLAGNVGGDSTGAFLRKDMENLGADTRHLISDPHHQSLVCLTVVDNDRAFYLWPPKDSASENYFPEQTPKDFTQFDIAHISGACFFLSPIAETLVDFMEHCKQKGVTVTFDLNARAEMFKIDERRAELFTRAIDAADIVLGSAYDEICLITKTSDPDVGSKIIADKGKVVVCRDGANPVKIFSGGNKITLPIYPGEKIDATGAGDAFDAGFLYGISSGMSLADAGRLGNVCGAYCVTKKGGRNVPKLKAALDIMKNKL